MNYIARKYALIIFSFCFSPFAFTQEAHLSILDSLFNHSQTNAIELYRAVCQDSDLLHGTLK